MEDPFISVKKDTEENVGGLFKLLERWRKLSSGTSAIAKQERSHVEGEVQKMISAINEDIQDLEQAILAVENNRMRFNITSDEIANRKYFVQQTKEQCRNVTMEIASPRHSQAAGRSTDLSQYSAAQHSQNRSNEVFIEKSMEQQQQIIRQQDDNLQLVGQSIGRLKEMGTMIGDEVDDQNQLLDDFYGDMGQTEKRMGNVQKKLDKILNKVDSKKQNIIIGVLLVIMIIVVVLFFSL